MASTDARRIDAVAYGVHRRGGVPLMIDATLRSVVSRDGVPHARAARQGGSTFARAYADKLSTYGDLAASPQCQFVCVAAETGGRFDTHSRDLVTDLVEGRAMGCRSAISRSLQAGWRRRIWGVLSVGLQRVVASSLGSAPAETDSLDFPGDVFGDTPLPRPVDDVHILECLRDPPAVSGLGLPFI